MADRRIEHISEGHKQNFSNLYETGVGILFD